MTAVVLVGHGSRVRSATARFETLVGHYARSAPDLDVTHGYLELAEPALESALLAAGKKSAHVVVMPLLLFAAGHAKNDLPIALERARRALPQVRWSAAPALGVHASLVALLKRRVDAALTTAPSRSAIVVVGRGSSDPDANADFCKVARLLAEGGDYASVTPAFAGIAEPSVPAALEWVARARPTEIVVAPYLLFGGRLTEKLTTVLQDFQARAPWTRVTAAEPLGAEPELLRALDERVRGALDGSRPLPCDTCQYRVPVSRVADTVGGLKALLWSLRHGLTHTQAMPHEHAHPPLTKHVLVCGNVDCAARGSIALVSQLRRGIKRAGVARTVRVTRTHCMGRCGEGPTVAVYPDGVWYRGVQPEDAPELLQEHLLNDRLVRRLVDNIMQ